MTADTASRDRDDLIDNMAAQLADAPQLIADLAEAIRRAAHLIVVRRELDDMPEVDEP